MAAQEIPNLFHVKDPTLFLTSLLPKSHQKQQQTPHLAGFDGKAPQLMLFSLADMIQCGAVCNYLYPELTTIAGRVKAIIKSVIAIIHSHAACAHFQRVKGETWRGLVRVWFGGSLLGGQPKLIPTNT